MGQDAFTFRHLPFCWARITAPMDAVGRQIRCPRCRGLLTVPRSPGQRAQELRAQAEQTREVAKARRDLMAAKAEAMCTTVAGGAKPVVTGVMLGLRSLAAVGRSVIISLIALVVTIWIVLRVLSGACSAVANGMATDARTRPAAAARPDEQADPVTDANASSRKAPPAPDREVKPPPPAQVEPPLTVVTLKWRWVEQNDVYWKASYVAEIRNETRTPITRSFRVVFLSTDGFEVDDTTTDRTSLAPFEVQTVRGTKLVGSGPAATISTIELR